MTATATATATLPTPTATPTATADREHHSYKSFKLTPVQQALVASVDALIWEFAIKCTPYHLRNHEWAIEESRDVILRNVCVSAFYFEFPRGLRFTTYAFGNAERNCYNYWKNQRAGRTLPKISLDADNDEGESLGDSIASPEDMPDYEHRENRETIKRIMHGQLTPREKRVLYAWYGIKRKNRQGCREIGDALKLTKSRVQQIKEKALVKLRRRAQKLKITLD